jgi:hypothetical protein
MMYGSLTHDYSGRKRKKAKSGGRVYERRVTAAFDPITKPLYNHRSSGQHIPSAPDACGAIGSAPQAKRVEGYTVAIGYNKGGYQVIPDNEIKYIGK